MTPGDINGDGYADLLAGCPYSSSSNSPGITYLLLGPLTAGGNMATLASATTLGEPWSATAYVNAFGDLNDDGYDDLAIGAHGWDVSGLRDVGKMYIVYGPHSTSLDFSTDSADPDDREFQWLGDGKARAADFTGDGIPDLLQGHHWDDPNGSYSGSIGFFEGPVASGSHIIFDADLGFIYGQSAEDRFGWEVEVADDIDGDGIDDLVVTALQRSYADYGKVYVITDPPPYGQNIQDVAVATITGDQASGFGISLSSARQL